MTEGSMVYSWYENTTAATTFAFTFAIGPPIKFCFDKVVPAVKASTRPFKRRRPLWDVDGRHSEGKKKRRLRLNLITSRLSRPFSVPATNIVDRGISKIAIWAKGKRLDKGSLRKAAIMNRVRLRLDAAKATAARRLSEEEESRRRQTQTQVVGFRQVMVQKHRSHDTPLPPSPLGLSNYDALDLEDEDCEGSDSEIYTDFNIMKPVGTGSGDGDEYDYLDELDGIPHDLAELPEERPPPPPDERMVEMLKEKERQKELCFVHFVA